MSPACGSFTAVGKVAQEPTAHHLPTCRLSSSHSSVATESPLAAATLVPLLCLHLCGHFVPCPRQFSIQGGPAGASSPKHFPRDNRIHPGSIHLQCLDRKSRDIAGTAPGTATTTNLGTSKSLQPLPGGLAAAQGLPQYLLLGGECEIPRRDLLGPEFPSPSTPGGFGSASWQSSCCCCQMVMSET